MLQRLWQSVRRDLFERQAAHFPALDGLRAIAALLIVAFHSELWLRMGRPKSLAALPAWVHWLFFNGWVGVDIFFVLSGFLIGRMLLLQLQGGQIHFRAFYIRRTFRIFPAYYLVLTLSIFVFARVSMFRALYDGVPWETLLRRSWANYLYVSNYAYGGQIQNAMAWGWSLCIEEHFYLILPLLLTVLFRCAGRGGRLMVLVVLSFLPLVARFEALPPHPLLALRIYHESHTHFDGLLLGVLIAYGYVFYGTPLSQVASRVGPLLWVAALCCFAAVFKWGGLWAPGLFALVLQFLLLAVGSSLLVINGLCCPNRVSRFLAHPAWCPVARLSYGIYLIHFFPILLVLSWWPNHTNPTVTSSVVSLLLFVAAATVLTVLGAAALFLALERPMLDWGARLSRR